MKRSEADALGRVVDGAVKRGRVCPGVLSLQWDRSPALTGEEADPPSIRPS